MIFGSKISSLSVGDATEPRESTIKRRSSVPIADKEPNC